MSRVKFCLNMIVKNEAHVIERCLSAAFPMLDFVRVIDTGSTDDTANIIRYWCMTRGINCVVRTSEWKDFATNRNEALAFAFECDATHFLLLDADEVLHINAKNVELLRKALGATDDVMFTIPMLYGNNVCTRTNLVKKSDGLAYKFPIHEELQLNGTSDFKLTMIGKPSNYIEGPHVTTPQDGARSQEEGGIMRDLDSLGKAYAEDKNPRHIFYMGQLMRILAHERSSLENWAVVRDVYTEYLKCMNGDYQPHCYVAALWVARVMEMEGREAEKVAETYLRVHEFDPGRPEAMGNLAAFYFNEGNFEKAREYALRVDSCRGSGNYAFLETKWYEQAQAIIEATEPALKEG